VRRKRHNLPDKNKRQQNEKRNLVLKNMKKNTKLSQRKKNHQPNKEGRKVRGERWQLGGGGGDEKKRQRIRIAIQQRGGGKNKGGWHASVQKWRVKKKGFVDPLLKTTGRGGNLWLGGLGSFWLVSGGSVLMVHQARGGRF